MIFNEIINKLLLNESVSVSDVNDAIDSHKRVIINYHTKGEDKNTGARVVEVYAYGLTKAGNPVIRCFQPYGDTTSRVPSWKFFRLDRISYWNVTEQTFDKPADYYYKGLGEFNPDGDDSMKTVFKIIKFGNNDGLSIETPSNGPKSKNGKSLYRTDTELKMDRLKQQLKSPITLSDIKTMNGFKGATNTKSNETGPKKKDVSTDTEPIKDTSLNTTSNQSDNIYKTDTERRMERLRQQMQNPRKIDLDKLRRK